MPSTPPPLRLRRAVFTLSAPPNREIRLDVDLRNGRVTAEERAGDDCEPLSLSSEHIAEILRAIAGEQ